VKKETSCCRIKLQQEVVYMARKYTKVEGLTEIIRQRKANGETNCKIAAGYIFGSSSTIEKTCRGKQF